MDTTKISVRDAVPGDATTIAQAVAMAIGDEVALREYCGDDYLAVLTKIDYKESLAVHLDAHTDFDISSCDCHSCILFKIMTYLSRFNNKRVYPIKLNRLLLTIYNENYYLRI